MLERERELAAVGELLEHGGAVLVEGGAGIGKTALLDASCRRAACAWLGARGRLRVRRRATGVRAAARRDGGLRTRPAAGGPGGRGPAAPAGSTGGRAGQRRLLRGPARALLADDRARGAPA